MKIIFKMNFRIFNIIYFQRIYDKIYLKKVFYANDCISTVLPMTSVLSPYDMAVFMINICKFNGCGITFPRLADLIEHIEDVHIGKYYLYV